MDAISYGGGLSEKNNDGAGGRCIWMRNEGAAAAEEAVEEGDNPRAAKEEAELGVDAMVGSDEADDDASEGG